MKKSKRKKRVKAKRSLTEKLVLAFMFIFIPAVSFSVYSQLNEVKILRNEGQRLALELESEKQKNLEIKNKQEYNTSEVFIEEVAREQLGYVKEGETIFIIK